MIDEVDKMYQSNITTNFPNSNLFNYILVISDDISYSGSQLSLNTYKKPSSPLETIAKNVTVFLNLVGYSEIAKIK